MVVAVNAAPALPAAVVAAEVAAPEAELLPLAAATGLVAVVPAVVVAKVAEHAPPVARHLHAAAQVVVVAATKAAVAAVAATATTTRNLRAPMPTWARTWATLVRVTAAPARPVVARVASPIRCARA